MCVYLKQVSPKYQYGSLQALDFLSVMDADGLESSHAISVDVAVSIRFLKPRNVMWVSHVPIFT